MLGVLSFKKLLSFAVGALPGQFLTYPPFPVRILNTLHIFYLLKVVLFLFLYNFHPPPLTPPSHTAGPWEPNKRFQHEITGRNWNRNTIFKTELNKNLRL